MDSETYLELIRDLDLFLFKDITVSNKGVDNGKPRQTNVLIEAMHRGFVTVVDYIFREGFTNIRAILKKNNQLEIENEVAQLNVSYFVTLIERDDLELLTKIYSYLVDLMQLGNFLEII